MCIEMYISPSRNTQLRDSIKNRVLRDIELKIAYIVMLLQRAIWLMAQ